MGKQGMKKSAMKSGMKKKVAKKKHVSAIAKGTRARFAVFSGRKQKTTSGLKQSDFTRNKHGMIVSKKSSARSKKRFANSGLKKWADACKKARKELGLTVFVAIGCQSAKGKALYAKGKSLL